MPLARRRLHLAQCDRCTRRIAWCGRRQRWLALAPLTALPGRRITRRLTCPEGGYHDPALSPLDRAFTLLVGAR